MDSKDLEKKLENIVQKNTMIKVNENLYLTNYQIEVLKEKHIPFESCNNVKDILFLLNEITDEDEWEDIEEVAYQLNDYSYYNESNK